MKSFFVIALAIASAAAGEDSGYCLGHEATGAICLQGSTLAEKLPAAFESCFAGGERRAKAAGNRGGDDMTCYSFNDIMAWVEQEFTDDGCVLKQIGWMDAEGNHLEDEIHADLATLAEGVQAGLSEQAVADCVAEKMAEGAEKYGHCDSAYTDEEGAVLMDVFTKIAGYKCFMGQFKEACGSFIEAEYVEPLIMSLYN